MLSRLTEGPQASHHHLSETEKARLSRWSNGGAFSYSLASDGHIYSTVSPFPFDQVGRASLAVPR